MRKVFGFIALATWLGSSQAAVEPLAITISDPVQSKGLTVIEIVFPKSHLTEAQSFEDWQWRVHDASGAIEQIYFSPGIKATQVTFLGLLREQRQTTLDFYVQANPNQINEQPRASITIDPSQAITASTNLLKRWAESRNWFFGTRANAVDGQTLLAPWYRVSRQAYGAGALAIPSLRSRRRPPPGNTLNAFSLFSGEAAIQETLQQQLIAGATNKDTGTANLSELRGPQIVSHPFEELLAGQAGGELAIAKLVPPERWLVHIGNPGKALGWLEQIATTGFQLSALQQQSYVQMALVERYLKRLGLSREFVEQLGPLAKQAALFGPDLFLQHGSNITLVVEAPNSPVLTGLLKFMLGIKGSADSVQAYANGAYFASHEQWLIFSTSQNEAEIALHNARSGGANSLGDSVEFRYMLSQLPTQAHGDSIYVYLSDPFIRAMVGPRMKIAQLRRHQARARLNLVTSAALLYQLDHGEVTSQDELSRLGYVQPDWLTSSDNDRITLDGQDQAIARSERYGTLAAMTPLDELAVDSITTGERDGYKRYVEDYSRFWRTTFDPIAIRIDIGEKIQVETLILPLVQNSIYNIVREALGGEPVSLTLPTATPKPVSTLSFKLSDLMIENAIPRHRREALDKLNWREWLGESVHVALYDADPIIALGSADLLGGFSGRWLRSGRRSNFLFFGFIATLLTQPTAAFIELQEGVQFDATKLHQLIRFMPDIGSQRLEPWGENGWVYTDDVEGILRFHLYIRQIDNYLVISNRQLDLRSGTDATVATSGNAGLSFDFNQIKAQAPSLHLHQMQQLYSAERGNRAQLLPFMLLGAATPQAAQQWHHRIYGSQPVHPLAGQWQWRSEVQLLTDSETALPRYHELPPEQRNAGPFSQLDSLQLAFRFVDEGVRIKLELQPKRANH